jgi:acetylornithine deacetylase/succinyl-diaminopimelate desuccinylase-like protein
MTLGMSSDAEFGETLLEETLAVCRIPSPTFEEGERARYVAGRLRHLGLDDVEVDELHNVTAVASGERNRTKIMLVAHMDTVFPKDTPVEPRHDGRYWHAPGIRDNSASVAVTMLLPELARRKAEPLRGDVLLAFSVGEEGLGNLRGIRALMERHRDRVSAVIAVDGNLGTINHVAITVRRLEISVETEGGHSWADAGKPSAIPYLARIAVRISELPFPDEPKTVLNIGTLRGGTSVNAIAQRAELTLDIRSIERGVVETLERQVREIVADVTDERCRAAVRVIGDRPGGMIGADHPLVRAIEEGYASVGVKPVALPGSTDANIPLSLGIAAASMGVSAGGRIHTLQEFLDPDSLLQGANALLKAVISFQEASEP